MSEDRNQSALARSLSAKKNMQWWVHCRDLVSCGVWAFSSIKPVAFRSTYDVERGRYTCAENFLWVWLWERCVDSGDQPAEHELSGL